MIVSDSDTEEGMAKFTDAGELNKRITFQHFIGEADLLGDFAYLDDDNWADDFTTWASIKTISGREFYAAGQEQGEVTHNVKIRHRPSWDHNPVNMRVVHTGHVYRLLTPPLELGDDKRYQQIKVAEVWP